jgi:hypothetical protein
VVRRVGEQARRIVRRFPPVARRDRRITELVDQRRILQARVRALTADGDRCRQANRDLTQANRDLTQANRDLTQANQGLSHAAELLVRVEDPGLPRIRRLLAGPARPSFHRMVMTTRRASAVTASMDLGARLPLRQVPRKLNGYRFAMGHGVSTPTLYGLWEDLADVPWGDLPEEFVFKADRGSAGRAVLPCRRHEGGYRVVDGSRDFSPDRLHAHWASLEQQGRAVGPYFAEELLADRHTAVVPVDLKVFAFYGEVAQILLRRIHDVGRGDTADFRYLLPDGSPLPRGHWRRQQALDIPVPGRLDEAVRMAQRLSVAVPLPFVRVDLYDVAQGVLFGELTVAPGGSRAFSRAHDIQLGALWDRASVRLQADLVDGRPYAMLPGPHPAELRMDPTLRLGELPAART